MKQNIEQNWGLGEPWADAWLLSCDDYFFHKAISWSCIQTLLLSKNACAIVVTGSEISNHLMLILQVRYSSNESVVQQERSKGGFTQNPVTAYDPAYGQRQSSHMQQEHHHRQHRQSGLLKTIF